MRRFSRSRASFWRSLETPCFSITRAANASGVSVGPEINLVCESCVSFVSSLEGNRSRMTACSFAALSPLNHGGAAPSFISAGRVA